MAILSSDLIRQGAAGASTGYTIDQSIRFNDDDSSRLYRTPSSAGNRRTHTFSVWLKRANLDSSGFKHIFSRSEASYFYGYYFYQDKLTMGSGSSGTELSLRTNRLFRDPAAWYHIVLILDTTQAISSERARMYINGVRETSFALETYPSLNAQLWMNTTSLTEIGVANPSGVKGGYFDGYMTDIYFLDGYAYGPEYFGEFKSDTDIWIPKEYEEGNYGTNGFHIDGRDSSDFGDDESGQGNDFTVAGLAANDQVSDSPTNNWCVMSPLLNNGCTYSNGNLEVAPPNLQSTHRLVLPTMGILPSDTNKYYWEITYLSSDNSSSVNMLGIAGLNRGDNPASATLNGDGHGYGLGYNTSTSNIYAGGQWTSNSPTWTGGFTAGAVYGVAYDGSTKRLYFYENNSALNSGNHFATYGGDSPLGPGASLYYSPSSSKLIFNMGANGFTYTPPTGYVAVNSLNLGS